MRKKVLIASSESSFRLLSSRFLRAKGDTVVTAINGLDGLHKLEAEPFDVALVDRRMPVLDGLGLCSQILETPAWKDTRIVLIIEENGPPDPPAHSERMMVIRQPFSMERLYAQLSHFCGEPDPGPMAEPNAEAEALLTTEDNIYLGMMKDMLEENSVLTCLIKFMHESESVSLLEDLGMRYCRMIREALSTRIRIYILQDGLPKLVGQLEDDEPVDEGGMEYANVRQAFDAGSAQCTISGRNYFHLDGVLFEVVKNPKDKKHLWQLVYSMLQNFLPIYKSFRDRAYFRRLKEQFTFANHLKKIIIENLHSVRDSSNDFASGIGENMDRMLGLVDELRGDPETLADIESIAMESMNRMQFTDINNQKLYSIIGNLEHMFAEMEASLATKDQFFNTTHRVSMQDVASESILDKNWQTNQDNVDDLLNSLGL